jgi:hypothetical protein
VDTSDYLREERMMLPMSVIPIEYETNQKDTTTLKSALDMREVKEVK